MELLQLKYFQYVAKFENITAAANELHISQPSLSITIKRLEEELNVSLFNRIGKKIELNDFGKVFLIHASKILNQIENAKSELSELAGIKNNHISLLTTNTSFLSGLLKNFLKIHSNITINQSTGGMQEIFESLVTGRVDFAITSPPMDEHFVETIKLIEEEIFVVVPKSNKFSNRKSIYLKELKDESFIQLTDNYAFREITKHLFEQAGFEPKIAFEGDKLLLSEIMYNNKAVIVVPKSDCKNRENENDYSIIKLKDNNSTRSIGLSYLKGRYLSDLSKSFKDYVIDYYKNF